MRYLDRLQPLALLVMRLALGAVMFVHGYHKVFGGLHHHADLVASLGLPRWSAYLSAFTEFLGGPAGVARPFHPRCGFCASASICLSPSPRCNFHNGLMGNGGYEFPLALAALAFGLIFFGGGPIAFDHIRAPGGRKSK